MSNQVLYTIDYNLTVSQVLYKDASFIKDMAWCCISMHKK